MCNTVFLTSFSGGRGQEKKYFLTYCKECLLHGQGQQEQPMCKYNHGKEYSNSKNPKMTPIKLSQMLFVLIAVHFNIVCIDHSHGKTDIRVFEEKERMLMMCTCSRQRSLSMKYFNKKHKISKTKKADDAKKFTLYQRPIPYNVNFLYFKIQNICHGQYLYSNQNLKSQDPSTM